MKGLGIVFIALFYPYSMVRIVNGSLLSKSQENELRGLIIDYEVETTNPFLRWLAKSRARKGKIHSAPAGESVYCALQDGRLVGVISVNNWSNKASIHDFYVDKGFRGQGIGTRLAEKALKAIVRNNKKKLGGGREVEIFLGRMRRPSRALLKKEAPRLPTAFKGLEFRVKRTEKPEWVSRWSLRRAGISLTARKRSPRK